MYVINSLAKMRLDLGACSNTTTRDAPVPRGKGGNHGNHPRSTCTASTTVTLTVVSGVLYLPIILTTRGGGW